MLLQKLKYGNRKCKLPHIGELYDALCLVSRSKRAKIRRFLIADWENPLLERNPEEDSLLHRTVTTAAQLQALPSSAVGLALFADAAMVGLFWSWRGDLTAAVVVAAGALVAGFVNWEMLRRLPLQGMSFGPDKPVALALGAAIALVVVVLGLFTSSVALALLVIALI